jgi:hypothetical protein
MTEFVGILTSVAFSTYISAEGAEASLNRMTRGVNSVVLGSSWRSSDLS